MGTDEVFMPTNQNQSINLIMAETPTHTRTHTQQHTHPNDPMAADPKREGRKHEHEMESNGRKRERREETEKDIELKNKCAPLKITF